MCVNVDAKCIIFVLPRGVAADVGALARRRRPRARLRLHERDDIPHRAQLRRAHRPPRVPREPLALPLLQIVFRMVLLRAVLYERMSGWS